MMDVRGYIGNISDREIDDSCTVMRQTNPLPDICGKVCDHPCESTCARGFLDEPVEIRKLKRYAIEKQYDEYEQKNRTIITRPSTIKNRDLENKIAIIGSGPAGLAAAHDLARLGYPVTIFEALSEPGGMLRVGIPNFRLPQTALQKEIEGIQNLGVELKLNTPIGAGLSISDLKSQGYKAIFISVGAHKGLRLGIEGEELDGVINGIQFLRDFNLDKSNRNFSDSKKVVVVGGGNVAIDCARTIKRLGVDEVYILYRRTKHEMPAADEELEQCESEGITIEYLVSPSRLIGAEGKVNKIECQRNELGAPDISGRQRPVPIAGSEFTLEVDNVIAAIGQEPELSLLTDEDDFELTKRSTFIIGERSGMTNIDGVFAGGDAVSGPDTVIGAIKAGKTAALGIDEFLSGDLKDNPNIYKSNAEHRTLELELLRLRKNQLLLSPEPIKNRNPEKLLDSVRRITSFAEVELPITSEEATSEARRCLSCRMCIGCGVCQAVCPKDAIDYTLSDEYLLINAKEVMKFPGVVESLERIDKNLKKLYKNSLNAVTPMEIEFMLNPESVYEGKIQRPYDGEIPQNIAFINMPELEYISDAQKKLNALELEYMMRLVKYIKTHETEINIRLFTNTTDLSELPAGYEYLMDDLVTTDELQDVVVKLDGGEFKIAENNENTTFDLEFNKQKHNFELIVVGAGLSIGNS
jgi:NADPH-dependent glutamate synthase beta subunit-like oxidoreductase